MQVSSNCDIYISIVIQIANTSSLPTPYQSNKYHNSTPSMIQVQNIPIKFALKRRLMLLKVDIVAKNTRGGRYSTDEITGCAAQNLE